MRLLGCRSAGGVMALAVVLSAGAAHATDPYDIELYKISVENPATGGTTYSEGQSVKIKCNFSVTKAAVDSSWPPVTWSAYVKVDGKMIHEFPVEITSSFGPKMSTGFGWSWKAQGAGAHTISCGLGNSKHTDIKPNNNEKSADVQVTALPKARIPAGNVAVKPMASVLPKPNLAIIGSQAKIETYCQKPQPALTATVTIKNSGGPLEASRGTVHVKEFGGANLSSAEVPLPAIGAGQTRTIEIPAMTLQPYDTLAGKHELQVIFSPSLVDGQPSFNKPAAPYVLTAVFPVGHCATRVRQPPSRSDQPFGQAGSPLPAVQQPQVRPDADQQGLKRPGQ